MLNKLKQMDMLGSSDSGESKTILNNVSHKSFNLVAVRPRLHELKMDPFLALITKIYSTRPKTEAEKGRLFSSMKTRP